MQFKKNAQHGLLLYFLRIRKSFLSDCFIAGPVNTGLMSNIRVLLLVQLSLICTIGYPKEIALTFDDSPRFARGYFDGPTRAATLLENLRSHQSGRVVFFSVSKRLNSEGKNRLNQYSGAGHLIANHTHSHLDINETSLQVYEDDLIIAHQEFAVFGNFKRWFRFPYLREGDTEYKRDGIRGALESLEYHNAYITINNYDWYIEVLFQKAIAANPDLDLEKMRRFYIEVLMEAVDFYDEMALRHIGRSPKHVLLLHEMDITALFIGDLIDELRKNQWNIVSAEEAYTDEISNYETNTVFPHNPGRIGEIAHDNGQIYGLWHESCDEKYLDRRFQQRVLLRE